MFRFNHPYEAKRLQKRHSVSMISSYNHCRVTRVPCVQEGLLDPHRLAKKHHHKSIRFPSTLPHQQPTNLSSVTVVELQSQAVVQATAHSPSAISVTSPGSEITDTT